VVAPINAEAIGQSSAAHIAEIAAITAATQSQPSAAWYRESPPRVIGGVS